MLANPHSVPAGPLRYNPPQGDAAVPVSGNSNANSGAIDLLPAVTTVLITSAVVVFTAASPGVAAVVAALKQRTSNPRAALVLGHPAADLTQPTCDRMFREEGTPSGRVHPPAGP